MAASSPKMCNVSYIDLPLQSVEHSRGLGIDIGGSVIKLVYLPKDKNPREGEPQVANGRQRIRLSLYPRQDLDKALQEISDLADIKRTDINEVPTIFTTGIGSNEYKRKITDVLGIETKNLVEFDLFVKCFQKLCKALTCEEITQTLHEEGAREANVQMDILMTTMAAMLEHTEGDFPQITDEDAQHRKQQSAMPSMHSALPYAEADDDLFPSHVVMLGSGFGVMQVNKDGSFSTVDGSNRGGASFLGLGKLLVGTDSYDELAKLAETGDDHELSMYTGDFKTDKDTDDIYSASTQSMGSMLTFTFAKARKGTLESTRKEDLARSLIVQYATDIATFVQLRAVLAGVSNVFLAGNFCNADVIREELSRHIIYRTMFNIPGKKRVRYHFLKHGGFYGALGAFLTED